MTVPSGKEHSDGSPGERTTLFPFAVANLLGLALNALTMHLALHLMALPEAVALVLATGGAFLWNYGTSKLVVFRV